MTQHVMTDSGFEIDLDVAVMDDMEVFEKIVAIDKGNVMELPALLDLIFTRDQKAALYQHCRNDAGRVPISAVAQEFGKIMTGLRDAEKK